MASVLQYGASLAITATVRAFWVRRQEWAKSHAALLIKLFGSLALFGPPLAVVGHFQHRALKLVSIAMAATAAADLHFHQLAGIRSRNLSQLLHHSLGADLQLDLQLLLAFFDGGLDLRILEEITGLLGSGVWTVAGTDGGLGAVQVDQVLMGKPLVTWIQRGHLDGNRLRLLQPCPPFFASPFADSTMGYSIGLTDLSQWLGGRGKGELDRIPVDEPGCGAHAVGRLIVNGIGVGIHAPDGSRAGS